MIYLDMLLDYRKRIDDSVQYMSCCPGQDRIETCTDDLPHRKKSRGCMVPRKSSL
jgi:hypothetical protein